MYTESDLNQAEKEGILPTGSVARLRTWTDNSNHTLTADEENVRLLSSFNDVFVFLAITLVLVALGSTFANISDWAGLGFGVVAIASWFLAEYFTRKRRMALPSIQLLVTFVGGLGLSVFQPLAAGEPETWMPALAGLVMICGAALHWWRFRVPITIAMGALSVVVLALSLPMALMPLQVSWWMEQIPWMMLICGAGVLFLALYWDQQDLLRKSWQSDVAFWCHLAAAPLIVHALFHLPGISFSVPLTLVIYLFMAVVALLIDRRSLLVSALIYVISSLSELSQSWQGEHLLWLGLFALGAFLLCLSVFWQILRRNLVGRLPVSMQSRVPVVG